MSETFNHLRNYPIEVSGWGLDNSFFVEKSNLLWSQNGIQVLLRRALSEGTMIFVRLLNSEPAKDSMPVAYQVKVMKPMDSDGRCLMSLSQLRPRTKAPIEGGTASDGVEDLEGPCEPRQSSIQLEPEEILR